MNTSDETYAYTTSRYDCYHIAGPNSMSFPERVGCFEAVLAELSVLQPLLGQGIFSDYLLRGCIRDIFQHQLSDRSVRSKIDLLLSVDGGHGKLSEPGSRADGEKVVVVEIVCVGISVQIWSIFNISCLLSLGLFQSKHRELLSGLGSF